MQPTLMILTITLNNQFEDSGLNCVGEMRFTAVSATITLLHTLNVQPTILGDSFPLMAL